MVDIGYREPVPGIYGTANPATDSSPESRAALQEATAQQMFLLTQNPDYVPQSYQRLGLGALPKVGWTAQKDANVPVFPPYTPTGRTPDWTGDVSNGGGAYDQGPVMTGQPANRLNRAPVGEEWSDGTPPNPAQPTTIVSSPGDREW